VNTRALGTAFGSRSWGQKISRLDEAAFSVSVSVEEVQDTFVFLETKRFGFFQNDVACAASFEPPSDFGCVTGIPVDPLLAQVLYGCPKRPWTKTTLLTISKEQVWI